MEREGEGRREEKRRGEGGGEMMRGRRGIVIGGMVLGLLMGCNNGGELAAEKGLNEIGRSVENTFYSFLSLIADTLGFRVTKDTTKQQVGQHFTALGTKIGEASKELDKVAEKAAGDGDKEGGILNKAIKEAVDAAKATLGTLKTNVDLLGTVGGTNVVGWAVSATQGAAAADSELKKAYSALRGIVEIAKESKAITELKTSDAAVSTVAGVATPQDGIKILGTNAQPTANDEAKAAAIVSKVSGEAMLDSIIKSKDGDEVTGVSSSATGETSAVAFAKGGTDSNLNKNVAKAAAVAGGIALRSLVKDGKLGATSNLEAVSQGAGTMASNKLIGTVEDIIKKTLKNILETAKQKIDEARKPKAVGN